MSTRDNEYTFPSNYKQKNRIVANIWPHTHPYYKDVRFHFYSLEQENEMRIIQTLLPTFGKKVLLDSDKFLLQALMKPDAMNEFQKKLSEFGIDIRWITIQ
jgi:hypothetical protein